MSDGWAIDIHRSDITRAKLVPDPAAPLSPGQVRVRIDSYAMTANNITYAVFGHPSGLFGNDQGYWDFFAERDRPGRLPVWGSRPWSKALPTASRPATVSMAIIRWRAMPC